MTVLIISQRDWKIEQIKNYRIIYINGLHRKSNKCWAMYQMGKYTSCSTLSLLGRHQFKIAKKVIYTTLKDLYNFTQVLKQTFT